MSIDSKKDKKLKKLLIRILNLMGAFGVDPLKTIRSIRGLPAYFSDFQSLLSQRKSANKKFNFGKLYPCLDDRFAQSGTASGHYFHQDLLVARQIYRNNPNIHADVGSRVDGFIAHVASFRPIKVLDIRPTSNNIPNVEFIQADLMKPINDDLVNSCDSLSCLHALEHFGLGRYGDPVNYDGYLIGIDNMSQILKRHGRFYFSVPIGPQRIEFNAHRVFSVEYLLELFYGKYHVDRFSFVDDKGNLHEDVVIDNSIINSNFGCNYGCGIFEMTKL
jgi:SAM-dependent methyltransferase